MGFVCGLSCQPMIFLAEKYLNYLFVSLLSLESILLHPSTIPPTQMSQSCSWLPRGIAVWLHLNKYTHHVCVLSLGLCGFVLCSSPGCFLGLPGWKWLHIHLGTLLTAAYLSDYHVLFTTMERTHNRLRVEHKQQGPRHPAPHTHSPGNYCPDTQDKRTALPTILLSHTEDMKWHLLGVYSKHRQTFKVLRVLATAEGLQFIIQIAAEGDRLQQDH